MSGGFRVSIPNSVKKTIQNIKEISGNHTDDEIYAMLKECSMDPNETAQKLLHQDTFHEVRRKRDRRKENVNSREPADSRWRPGMQGRGGRGGRGNHSSRYITRDDGSGRNLNAGKEIGDGGISQEAENKAQFPISSTVSGLANGPTNVAHGSSTRGLPAPTTPNSDQFLASATQASVSGVYSSASDPVLVPSLDSRVPGVVGTIKREVGSQRTAIESSNKRVSRDTTEPELSPSTNEEASSEIGNPFIHGKMPSKSQGIERSQLSETSQVVSTSSHAGSSSSSRPSSNYSNRSQQLIGSQKAVGPSKEWKPKPTNPNIVEASGTITTSDIPPFPVEANTRSLPEPSATSSEETTLKLQKKLEELHFSDRQHVIIPNHLQVPEAERTRLSFGSFDANFGVTTSFSNGPGSDKSSTPLSESSQVFEETAEEPLLSNQNASPTAHRGDYLDHPQSPTHMPESLSSGEVDVSSGTPPVPEYDQSKPEAATPGGGPQYSGFGFMPPILGSQFTPFEGSESQARDASRLQSFVVPQPFDQSTYYTQFYRPGADGDGRFSPFLAPSAATKYNGNIVVLSAQTGQSPQESGNSLVLSTAGPSPLVSQSAGVVQSSVTQQPVPVFRQTSGVHLSHYPLNYFPYNQYFSPIYGPAPTIHHFLSNTAFPQQPPAGTMYPPPAAAATTAVKYPLSQYKTGNNTGNSTHIGMPTGYGPYSSAPAGYSPSPAVTTGNSNGNEDLSATQYKENNVYLNGQQSEGSTVWISAPGRDISGLQPSSFYNLTPQGQHVTYAPMQSGHGAFPSIYHPAQTVPAANVHPMLQQSQSMAGGVEMVGPPTGVYQQPQRAQINWGNNY
ncbi:flocculation protein (DUF1296) [Tasmannia lanceolata]|uniref:flocculation protein (DUF1296) n=1 Tax=Tasmannia lanceolata TaxID=3420 RepID=UPI00406353BB